MNALVFFGIVAAAVVCFAIGWITRGQKDKPVMVLREDDPNHSKEFPHHVHPHDFPKK